MTPHAPDALGAALKAGEIDRAYVEGIAAIVFEDEAERTEQIASCFRDDGSLNEMKVRFINRSAWTASRAEHIAELMDDPTIRTPSVPAPVLPDWMLADVPEAFDEDDGVRQRNFDFKEEVKRKTPILTAVRMWGKPQAKIKIKGVDGNMIRCPFPEHEDNNPSASANTEKDTWVCHACDRGGDVIDYYLARRGFSPEAMRGRPEWGALLDDMGMEVGVRRVESPKGEEGAEHFAVDLPSGDPDDGEEPAPSAEAHEPVTITEEEMLEGIDFGDDWEPDPESDEGISYEWRDLPIWPGTFLHKWMTENEEEYRWIPPEYFLFLGLQAVGLAAGHHVYGFNDMVTTGAMMTLIIGPSGWGKSTAQRRLIQLVRDANPFYADTGEGIRLSTGLASGEAMTMLQTMVEDPSDVTAPKKEVPTTTLYHEDEFATFAARAGRTHSSLKPRVIGAFDFYKTRDEPEVTIEDDSISRGNTKIHDLFFTGSFLTQNDAMRTILRKEDLVTGFLSRMLPVIGKQRERRVYTGVIRDYEEPRYVESYKTMVRRLERFKRKLIPYSEEAIAYMNDDPMYRSLGEDKDSIYSRLELYANKIAFCLAINDVSDEVTLDHIRSATVLIFKYVAKTFGAAKEKVVATEIGDTQDAMYEFIKGYFLKRRTWPHKRDWAQHRTYKNADPEARSKAQKFLVESGRVVEVAVMSGKGRTKYYWALPEFLTDEPVPRKPWSEAELREKTIYPGESDES